MLVISIHALRGEGDLSLQCVEKRQREDFNPRPPWGGRQNQGAVDASVKEFQSTPSVGRATATNLGLKNDRADFNPRPPWGGRLCHNPHRRHTTADISIHALRGEGDLAIKVVRKFGIKISIHALRGEGDRRRVATAPNICNFNPRPPWGGRQELIVQYNRLRHFNPRPPWGGRHRPPFSESHHTKNFNPRPPWGGRH